MITMSEEVWLKYKYFLHLYGDLLYMDKSIYVVLSERKVEGETYNFEELLNSLPNVTFNNVLGEYIMKVDPDESCIAAVIDSRTNKIQHAIGNCFLIDACGFKDRKYIQNLLSDMMIDEDIEPKIIFFLETSINGSDSDFLPLVQMVNV